MEHLSKLQDFGIGKRCLIVGGGESLNKFQWDKLNGTYMICTNDHYSQMADMIIYYDRHMKKHYSQHCVSNETLLVGFKNVNSAGGVIDYTVERCDYYYSYDDMVFGDSGFHALQFADRILNFSHIYLIGFDYETTEKSYHHNEDVSDPKMMKKFKTWSIGKVLKEYDKIKWANEIYNCNKNSKLEVFGHGFPY